MTGVPKVNDRDKLILRELQKNCTLSLKELGNLTGISLSTLHNRIQQMKDEGIIEKFSAIINPEAVGQPVTAFILIGLRQVDGGDFNVDDIMKKIAALPETQEVHMITGGWDLLVKVKCKDIKSIGGIVMGQIRGFRGVSDSKTFICTDRIKETSELHF